MANPRLRATQIISNAGTSPSVNLPVLPIVPEAEVGNIRRWAIALTSQLDIWFNQLKDTLVQVGLALTDRPVWKEPYFPGETVPLRTMVEDDGWLMVSNKVTDTRAAPQVEGPLEFVFIDTPTWVTNSVLGVVEVITEFALNTGGLCQEFRVWPPAVGPDITYLFEVVVTTGDDGIPYSRSFFNPFLLPNQWNVIALADLPLPAGSKLSLRLIAYNSASATGIGPFPWEFQGASNSLPPQTGQWNRANNNRSLKVHKFDADGIDRSADLLQAGTGSRGLFEDVNNSFNFREYLLLEDVIDQGDYVEFPAVSMIDSGGSISPGTVTDLSGQVPLPAATEWVEILNYFPTGNPSWGTAVSDRLVGGVSVGGQANTGFGVDLGLAPGTVSADWDYMNYAPITTAESTTQGSSLGPRMQRELEGQLIEGSVQTTNNAWTEVFRFDVAGTHKGIVTTKAMRSDQNDAYDSQLNYLCLLNGTLTINSTMVYEHSTAPSIRARIDSAGTSLLIEVQGNASQTWDWDVVLIKRPI